MRSLFIDIGNTVGRALNLSDLTSSSILSILDISRSWYYRYLDPDPALDRRFNSSAVRDGDEWIVIGFKHRNPRMSHREIAYTLMDEDIAHLSPSTVYRILKKHDLMTPWKHLTWGSTRPEHAKHPDERWQTDIMYIKIRGRFFYLLIFIDEYSRYIVHHALLISMDAGSVSLEAQAAIDILRRDSIAEPVIQSDNGSSFIAMEFKLTLKANNLTQKLIRPHTPEQNGIVERSNKTTREALVPIILVDYEQAKSGISRIIENYNNHRRHSSLQYLMPVQYYRGEPEILLAVREAKMEKAKSIRREENMKNRKGGVATGNLR